MDGGLESDDAGVFFFEEAEGVFVVVVDDTANGVSFLYKRFRKG